MIGVLDGLRLRFHARADVLVFHCRATGGELERHLECADVGWFAEDALPWPVAGYPRWGKHAFAAIRGEDVEVLYDPPRAQPWRE